jgi:hypothetical protein
MVACLESPQDPSTSETSQSFSENQNAAGKHPPPSCSQDSDCSELCPLKLALAFVIQAPMEKSAFPLAKLTRIALPKKGNQACAAKKVLVFLHPSQAQRLRNYRGMC